MRSIGQSPRLTALLDRPSIAASKRVNGRGRTLDVSAASGQGAEKSGHPRPVPLTWQDSHATNDRVEQELADQTSQPALSFRPLRAAQSGQAGGREPTNGRLGDGETHATEVRRVP